MNLREHAVAIADQYLANIPPAYEGRYSELADPSTVEVLLKGFAAGLKPVDCCHAAGIHPRTLSRWEERAEAEPESAFASFVAALKAARAQGKLRRLQKIEEHGNKEWVALAWINERTDPEQFALRRETGSGPAIVVNVASLNASDVKIGIQTGASGPDQHTLTTGTMSTNQVESAQPIDAIVLSDNHAG